MNRERDRWISNGLAAPIIQILHHKFDGSRFDDDLFLFIYLFTIFYHLPPVSIHNSEHFTFVSVTLCTKLLPHLNSIHVWTCAWFSLVSCSMLFNSVCFILCFFFLLLFSLLLFLCSWSLQAALARCLSFSCAFSSVSVCMLFDSQCLRIGEKTAFNQ